MWTKKAEMVYWTAKEDDYYLSNIRFKYETLNVQEYFPNKVNLAVDVGGGKFGGALYYFQSSEKKILVDALAPEFRQLGNLPEHIDTITADFANIPLKDAVADSVFCWNTLDHCNSISHFFAGITEVIRLLKQGGLLFLTVPLRDKPNDNHPVCIKQEYIMHPLEAYCNIVSEKIIGEPNYRDNVLFVVAKKR